MWGDWYCFEFDINNIYYMLVIQKYFFFVCTFFGKRCSADVFACKKADLSAWLRLFFKKKRTCT